MSKIKIAAIVIAVVAVIALVLYFTVFKKTAKKVDTSVPATDASLNYEGSLFTDRSMILNGYYMDSTGTPIGVVKAGGEIYAIDGTNTDLGNVQAGANGLPSGGYIEKYGTYTPQTSILSTFQTAVGLK